MLGPFSLRYLHLFVAQRSAGSFILSKNGRAADFVGFSSDDLAHTLGMYRNRPEYGYFWFSYAPTSDEALNLAHYWYHRYSPSDNRTPPHPSTPSNWRCTEVGCTACALAGRKA